jgi:hypothetical protein
MNARIPFFLAVSVICIYSSCKKQDETVEHLPVTVVRAPTSVFDKVCGKYIVSGWKYDGAIINNWDQRIYLLNDTILITRCNDSSISCNLSVYGRTVCCSPHAPFQWQFSNAPVQWDTFPGGNVFGSIDGYDGTLEMYFPVNHTDSIYYDGAFHHCNSQWDIHLTGIKIH